MEFFVITTSKHLLPILRPDIDIDMKPISVLTTRAKTKKERIGVKENSHHTQGIWTRIETFGRWGGRVDG